jgi:hypothetical protein
MHIPKTAGMSVRQALKSQYSLSAKLPAESWEEFTKTKFCLSNYRLFLGHYRFFFREVLPADTYSFTFFRDPARRTLSHLNHLLADPSFHALHAVARGRDIRSLIEDPQIISQCANAHVSFLSKPTLPVPRSLLFDSTSAGDIHVGENDFESAVENLGNLSFVGFYDDLQPDFAHVCDDLNLHPPLMLPVNNTALARNQTGDVSDEVMEMLREANILDYRLFSEALKKRARRTAIHSRDVRCRNLIERGVYQTIRQPVEFLMTEPVPAIGLWEQELVDGTSFRWTGPDRSVTFELPLDQSLRFKFEVSLASPKSIVSLAAYVNGVSARIELKILNSSVATIEVDVIPSQGRPITEIELRCDRTFRPDNADVRILGFIIGKASIRPYGTFFNPSDPMPGERS